MSTRAYGSIKIKTTLSSLLRLNVDLKSFLIPHILLIWLLLTFITSKKLKSHLRDAQYGSNEAVVRVEAVDEYLGDQEKGLLLRRYKEARTEMG